MAVVVIFIMIGFFLFSASVYNYSFGRLLFVSGLGPPSANHHKQSER
jgi:glutamate:GABA antiporter